MRTQDNPFAFIVPFLKFLPVFLIVVALVIFVILMIRRNIKENPKERADGKSVAARVISKRERKMRDPNISAYDQNRNNLFTYFYYATFELKNYERVELAVKGDVYHSITEDQTGTLTYQGSQFIDFIPDEF